MKVPLQKLAAVNSSKLVNANVTKVTAASTQPARPSEGHRRTFTDTVIY